MTFDKLWEKVPGLTNTAKKQILDVLTPYTKKRLEEYSPFEIGSFVRLAIDEIEHGSIETIDDLVRKRLL